MSSGVETSLDISETVKDSSASLGMTKDKALGTSSLTTHLLAHGN